MIKPRRLAATYAYGLLQSRGQYKAWGGALGFFSSNCRAMASYAKQADDDSLRKHADRIQARAVRRAQELLKQFPEGRGAGYHKTNKLDGADELKTRRQTAHDAGMSDRQRKTALRVANVPEADFEQQSRSGNRARLLAIFLWCLSGDGGDRAR